MGLPKNSSSIPSASSQQGHRNRHLPRKDWGNDPDRTTAHAPRIHIHICTLFGTSGTTMNPHSPPSTSAGSGYPHKRARHSSPDNLRQKAGSPGRLDEILPEPLSAIEPGTGPGTLSRSITSDSNGGVGGGAGGKAGQSSSFRNVSACNRCRLRKNRCDQRLPSCASCEKAGVKCVGYDPITKREIPRR